MRSDHISVLEAAYSLDGGEQAWLGRVHEAASKVLKPSRNIAAFTFMLTKDSMKFGSMIGPDDQKLALEGLRTSPEGVAYAWKLLNQGPAGTTSSFLGPDAFAPFAERMMRPFGFGDAIGITARDPSGAGCVLSAPRLRQTTLSPREVARWSWIATHLAAGLRLQTQFAALDTAPGLENAEAILQPDGKLEHATRGAAKPEAREALRRAVKALDRARSALRRTNSDEAISIWSGLVDGRWSITDHFESDGRRYIVARRNDPDAPARRGLTIRERQVFGYAALGHSNKLIAYELGLAPSTVATHLTDVAAKLGFASRVELIEAENRLGAVRAPRGN